MAHTSDRNSFVDDYSCFGLSMWENMVAVAASGLWVIQSRSAGFIVDPKARTSKQVTLPRRKPDAGMNTPKNDCIDVSWNLRVQYRCDEVLTRLSSVVGNLRKPRRRELNQSTRLSIYQESSSSTIVLNEVYEQL
jgi:hypothetical protein